MRFSELFNSDPSDHDRSEPRCAYHTLVHRVLRDEIFMSPLLGMHSMSIGDDAFWDRMFAEVDRLCPGQHRGFSAENIEFHPAYTGDRLCAMIELPPPHAVGEAFFVAVVMLPRGEAEMEALIDTVEDYDPQHNTLRVVRYFLLERSAGLGLSSPTRIGEWLPDGTYVDHGDGPDPDPLEFADALAEIIELSED